ncbi:MAG: hypothetical protein MJZ20_03325 [Bacteroidaceae bacterium]|nr:hypothetical protein [Bacteroidaceae bacterium]
MKKGLLMLTFCAFTFSMYSQEATVLTPKQAETLLNELLDKKGLTGEDKIKYITDRVGTSAVTPQQAETLINELLGEQSIQLKKKDVSKTITKKEVVKKKPQKVAPLVEQTSKAKESNLSLVLSGEVDASICNYTGSRFDSNIGPAQENSATGEIPSFDIALEYEFAPKWSVYAETEFVSGCGIQVDEISLSYKFHPSLSIKGGVLALPIGHCNNGYSYKDYFTTGDPEGEFSIIPCPFVETGIGIFGDLKYDLSYELDITTGLNPMSFTAHNFIQDATQGFKTNQTSIYSPGISGRITWAGIKGLRISAGGYYSANTAHNMPIFLDYRNFCLNTYYREFKVPATLLFADAEYTNNYFTIRGSYLHSFLENTIPIADFFNSLDVRPEGLKYDGGLIGKQAVSYMGEFGFNIKKCFYPNTNGPVLIPFVHYECYNPQHSVAKNTSEEAHPCSKVQALSFGMNWCPLDDITVKFNYTTRKLGDGGMNSMNDFNIGLAYELSVL